MAILLYCKHFILDRRKSHAVGFLQNDPFNPVTRFTPPDFRRPVCGRINEGGLGTGGPNFALPRPLNPSSRPTFCPQFSCPFAITCIFSVYPLYKCIENINTNKNLSSRSTMPRLNKRAIRKRGYTNHSVEIHTLPIWVTITKVMTSCKLT